jgi:hypothetical protein
MNPLVLYSGNIPVQADRIKNDADRNTELTNVYVGPHADASRGHYAVRLFIEDQPPGEQKAYQRAAVLCALTQGWKDFDFDQAELRRWLDDNIADSA